MICGITGVLKAVSEGRAVLHIHSFDYEVLIPEFTRIKLQSMLEKDISLHTIQYLEGNPAQGRLTPRFVGFLTDIEREFFEMFCSVDGVGVKKALRAMVRPVRDVATMIEEQDSKGLSTLPGIGPATSERIIAKLRRKMPKFALIASSSDAAHADVAPDIVRETYQVLMQLGHNEADSRKLIDSAVGGKKKFKDVDSLIKEIYAQVQG